MAMYQKDKVTRVTLRLTERQFNFVKENADLMGVSPSEFLRMVVNMTMMSTQKFGAKFEEIQNNAAAAAVSAASDIQQESGEGCGRENDKANKHDKL